MRSRLASVAVISAVTVLVLAACGGGGETDQATGGFEDCEQNPNTCNSGEAQSGGEIIWTLDQAATGYFPMSPGGGSVYTLQAIQGILPNFGQFMPDGEYQHNLDVLAAEPEMVSEEPLVTEWQISEDAVWNDGTPISADDVRITWMMSTPADMGLCDGCQPRALLDTIANVEGSDGGKTVTITYQEGVSDPEWFAFGSAHNIVGGIVPAHIAEQNGWDMENPQDLGEYFQFLHDNPPEFSGGPLMIEEFDLDSQVVKVPNPNWYGEQQPTLERITIKFLTEADTWLPALQNQELHGASPASWAEDVVRQVLDMENVLTNIQAGPSWEHIDFNMDNEWLGGDVELRRAIFTAIDRQDMAERIYGELFPDIQTRGNHIFPPDSEYYVDHLEGTGQGSGDVEAARQILADAGYEGSEEGGTLTLDGEQVGPFRLRATTAPARVTATQLIQDYLSQIGIQVELEPTDDLGGTLVEQDYDLIEFGWSGSPLFFQNGKQYWETGSGSNFGNYSNEQVDELIAQEAQAATLDESAELHNQMMEVLVPDAYVLPLYTTPVYLFVTDDYVDVRDNTNSSLRALYQHYQWSLAAE